MQCHRKRRKLILAAIAGIVFSLLLMGFVSRKIHVLFSDGASVNFIPASFWESFIGSLWTNSKCISSCKCVYQTKTGKVGKIVFWEDLFDRPIICIPAGDGDAIFCLYEFDTSLILLRIDAAKNFNPPPNGRWHRLNAIVCSSPWFVEDASAGDWQKVLKYLETLSKREFTRQAVPAYDFGLIRFGLDPEYKMAIVSRIEIQIKYMHDAGAVQWPE